MMSFEMSGAVAEEFWRLVIELKLETEEERTALLVRMAQEGLLSRVVQTDRTKEQYVADLKKNFGAVEAKDFMEVDNKCGPACFDPEKTLIGDEYVWTKDSETGEFVLLDRRTNKEVMRRKP